jgi:hypothetical protein
MFEMQYPGMRIALGSLKVGWTQDMPFEGLIPKVCAPFSLINQLNYMLWKYSNK